jgi:hypothetical protein
MAQAAAQWLQPQLLILAVAGLNSARRGRLAVFSRAVATLCRTPNIGSEHIWKKIWPYAKSEHFLVKKLQHADGLSEQNPAHNVRPDGCPNITCSETMQLLV